MKHVHFLLLATTLACGNSAEPDFCEDAIVRRGDTPVSVRLTSQWGYRTEEVTGECISPCLTCVIEVDSDGQGVSALNQCSQICETDDDCNEVWDLDPRSICVGECGVKACVLPCETDEDCGGEGCTVGLCLWFM